MDITRFQNIPVIDCHVHHRITTNLMEQTQLLTQTITQGHLRYMYTFGGNDHASLYLKAKHTNQFYAGAYIPWTGEAKQFGNKNWEKYIHHLMELGYDGVGEMGSKPVTRDKHTPLDSPYYQGLWETCETHEFPILCHIGDVEAFWYEETTPKWAKDRDWGYYNGDYPRFQELYHELFNVLNHHPHLKITLCHFLFMTPDITQAREIMNTHPNITIDLSPGIEFLHDISKKPDEWRNFMIKYEDRILYGTDIGMSTTIQQHLNRIWLLRMLLETKEEFHTPETSDQYLTRYQQPFTGLNLPRKTLNKIYHQNFQNHWGTKPKPINLNLAIETSKNPNITKALESLL